MVQHSPLIPRSIAVLSLVFTLLLGCSGAGSRQTQASDNPHLHVQENVDPEDKGSDLLVASEDCEQITRFLNPPPPDQPSENELDHAFEVAYEAAVSGEFAEAMAFYQEAEALAACECDRQHAKAGIAAVAAALEFSSQQSGTSSATQLFWVQLQTEAEDTACVAVR